jgi:hypothetical protein
MRIHLENGKYTYEHDEQGQRVLRHGEPWRDLCGDKFVGAMADEITRLRDALTSMTEERDRLLVTPPETREDLWCVISNMCDGEIMTDNATLIDHAGHRLGHLMKQPGYALEIERLITLAKNEARHEAAVKCNLLRTSWGDRSYAQATVDCETAILALVEDL